MNRSFDKNLDSVLMDFVLEEHIEKFDFYLESADNDMLRIINEGFGKRKDLDWYSTKIIISKKNLNKLISRVRSGLRKRNLLKETSPTSILKKFFIIISKANVGADVENVDVEIEKSGGSLAKIIISIGTKPDGENWSKELTDLFSSFSHMKNSFYKRPSDVAV